MDKVKVQIKIQARIVHGGFLEVGNVECGCSRERRDLRGRWAGGSSSICKGPTEMSLTWGGHVAFKSVLGLNLTQTLKSWKSLGNLHDFQSNNWLLKYIKWKFITTPEG